MRRSSCDGVSCGRRGHANRRGHLGMHLGDRLRHLGCQRPIQSPERVRLRASGRPPIAMERGPHTLCSANMANSLISNPLKITVIVNSADDIQIDWELDDGGGKLLEAVSQYDDYDSQNPVWSTSRAVLVQGFISRPSESERGTLTISPSRYTIGNGTEDLPKLRIPVRLTTATTTITILTPADPKSVRRRSCHLDGFSNRSRQL
jgi:hypothetical protein